MSKQDPEEDLAVFNRPIPDSVLHRMSIIQDAARKFSYAFSELAISIEQYEQAIEQFKYSLRAFAVAIGDDIAARDIDLWHFYTKMHWLQNAIGIETFGEWLAEGFGLSNDEFQAIIDRKAREALETRIAELRSLPYREYLQSPEWKERAALARERAGYRCQVCNAINVQLNVHHRTYERLGNEVDGDLTVLCQPCHQIFHEKGKLVKEHTA